MRRRYEEWKGQHLKSVRGFGLHSLLLKDYHRPEVCNLWLLGHMWPFSLGTMSRTKQQIDSWHPVSWLCLVDSSKCLIFLMFLMSHIISHSAIFSLLVKKKKQQHNVAVVFYFTSTFQPSSPPTEEVSLQLCNFVSIWWNRVVAVPLPWIQLRTRETYKSIYIKVNFQSRKFFLKYFLFCYFTLNNELPNFICNKTWMVIC